MVYRVPTVNDSNEHQTVSVTAGDVYCFMDDVYTRSNLVHNKGDLLLVLDSTLQTPHGEISESGVNWVCETRHSTSVWATLEQCIARGLLKKRAE